MKPNHLSGVMHELVAGIHVFLAGLQNEKDMDAATSQDKPGNASE